MVGVKLDHVIVNGSKWGRIDQPGHVGVPTVPPLQNGNVGYRVLTDTLVLTERNIKTLPKLHLLHSGKLQHDILPFVTLILAEQ